ERRACQHACHNTPGSFLCSCRPGYRLSRDRVSCEGCLNNGVAHAEGEVFTPSDGNCTICVCLAGNISCISPECPPGSCPSASPPNCCSCQPAKCSFRGRSYAHGARFSLDGDECTTCICRADGSVSCKRTDCVETCPYPIHIPGQCCPDCSAGDGDSRGRGDDTVLRALQPHSRPIGCTYMGRIFYNNETFPSLLDPCLSCICLLGSVACSPVDCAIFCTYPFHPEGECCPVCK
ncbi:hypothetical protein CIB84_015886, partial [Bambusicola thoracicus]